MKDFYYEGRRENHPTRLFIYNDAYHFLLPDIYSCYLKKIKGIRFTRREIDIIAFLISGRSTKKIAAFLSLSPKTVANHTQNIMVKLGCNSRDAIIDFVERSDRFLFLKKYYSTLLSDAEFEKSLKKISILKDKAPPLCAISYLQEHPPQSSLLHYLETHLRLAGVAVSREARENNKTFYQLTQEPYNDAYVIYIICGMLPKSLQTGTETESALHLEEVTQFPTNKIFLFSEKKNLDAIPKCLTGIIDYIDLREEKNYYYLVFEILKIFLPNFNFEDVISEFYKRNDELNNSSAPISSQLLSQRKPLGQQENLTALKTALFLKIKKRHLLLALLSLGLLGFGFLSFKWSYDGKERKYHDQLPRQKSKELLSVRSDLAVPSDLTFLNRPNLIDQINSYFQMSSQDIQTIAIIGIGGAGKTTLARQYARNHKSFVIWEMNAETKNSLTASFEDLAYALCQTEDERKILKALREIKDAHEKERSLLLLVKEKLRDQPDWLLIYDNVEAFSDIQKYFPYDAREWGNGKIIITSRDKNLESNRHINHIININELNKDEKRNLFFKIMSKTGNHKVFSEKIPSIELFLTSIPSFPLDVSVAAYYLKSTHVTYEEYLRRLNDSSNNFIKNQEFLLKETSSYYKTRYSIITLSLEQIIKANSNFEETLLFICLLDSQDIPRELLNKYKGDILIDDFIIHLKKYSLIKIGISSVGPTLSIHRSTQSIALNYIKNKLNLIENKKILDYIASCFENYISYTIKNNKFKKMKGLLRHGESFLNREYLFKNVSTVKIRGELGYAYYLLGDYQNAQHLLEKNQNLLNKNKYQDKIFFARTLTYLGIFYWYFGHFNKSFDLLKMSETVYEKSHTKDYWGLTKTLVYLGLVYPETNQAEKTKLPIEKALAIYKEHLPYDYKDKAFLLSYLGFIYREYDLKKSKEYLDESISIYEKHHMHDQIDFGWSLSHLGNYYDILGEYEKSVDLLKQTLKIYKNHYPEDGPSIAWALRKLGASYCGLGEVEKARQLLEKSLKIFKSSMGLENLKTKWVLYELGIVYMKMGEFNKAKDAFEDCLKHYKKQYGKRSVYSANVLRYLGENCLCEGDLENAEYYLKNALAIYESHHHIHIFVIFECLGELYLKKFKIAPQHLKEVFQNQAASYLAQALKFLKKHYPEDSPHLRRIEAKLRNHSLTGKPLVRQL